MTVIPSILSPNGGLTAEARDAIEGTITALSEDLHTIQRTLHDNPELAWQEHTAHDTCVAYMEQAGWKVTPHAYGFPTAWRAEFDNGDGPVIGFNSEMDALPPGHACGHNLICITGIGAAIGAAQFMRDNQIPGKVVLLGTPAEEAGGGKAFLLKKGAYDDMDVCLMAHPMGHGNGTSLMITACAAAFSVEFKGAAAHAAANPSAGVNALDAAVTTYNNVALLRQQIPDPTRVYITIKGSEQWAANIIASEAAVHLGIRAPSAAEITPLIPRALNCVKAAALATGCSYEIRREILYLDTAAGSPLLADYLGEATTQWEKDGYTYNGSKSSPGATDFGNVCYKLPAIHPGFHLPDVPKNEFPHSDTYAHYSGTRSATDAAIRMAAGLAFVGARAAADKAWLADVKADFEKRMAAVDAPAMLKSLEETMSEFPPGISARPIGADE